MKARILTSIVLACCLSAVTRAQTAIGTWRTHHSFESIRHVVDGGDRIYGAGKMGVIYYDLNDKSIGTLTRSSGLSEAGISTIAYDSTTNILLIAYTSSNIDLVDSGLVYNLSDIKRADIDGSRNINSISFRDGKAYISCDFGIVVVDELRREVENTIYLGAANNRAAVYDIAFDDGMMIAATSLGLMRAAPDDPYLNIADRWATDNTLAGLNETPRMLTFLADKLIVGASTFDPDSLRLYAYNSSTGYTNFYSGNLKSIRLSGNKLVVNKWSHVDIYSTSLLLERSLDGSDSWTGMANHDAILGDDNTLWVAHDWAGLLAFDLSRGGDPLWVMPQSPACNDNIYQLKSFDNKILLCPGGRQSTYANAYLPANVCTFEDDRWRQLEHTATLDTLGDVVDVAISPTDEGLAIAASWGHGLIEIRDNKVTKVYNESNSDGALTSYQSASFRSLRTGGVAFDKQGNLWVTNSLVHNGIAERLADGSWQSFNTYPMVGDFEIDRLLCDSVYGYKWFWGRANAVYVLDVRNGKALMSTIDPNNGSKKHTSSVNCLTQDHDGNIWMGTNNGIKVIYDAYKAFRNGGNGEVSPVTCSNIIIGNGSFVEYLMAYENISCIAVDGANRKWVGTTMGGLYLISANGQEELLHFTVANSPLLSNRIVSLAIHPQSGEVFVGTDRGLISYRSTATYALSTPGDDIHAFPNPVRPNYDGPIAIKGFTRDGLVHITDAAGHVVYSTRALGGQAIWHGRTNNGAPVSSGVYYVFASDEERGNRSVTKILVIK